MEYMLKARHAYQKTDDEYIKNLLAEIFGQKVLTQDITKLVTTFEDACTLTGEDPEDEKFKQGDASDIAFKRCKVIARALKEGVKMSYKDTKIPKWYAVLRYEAGVGFRFWLRGYDIANAPGGSALCFPTSELAKYFGTTFTNELIPIYESDNV